MVLTIAVPFEEIEYGGIKFNLNMSLDFNWSLSTFQVVIIVLFWTVKLCGYPVLASVSVFLVKSILKIELTSFVLFPIILDVAELVMTISSDFLHLK